MLPNTNNICIYIYIYIYRYYVCIYIYIYICYLINMTMYVTDYGARRWRPRGPQSRYVCIYRYIDIYISTCICMYMYMCISLSLSLYIYICIYRPRGPQSRASGRASGRREFTKGGLVKRGLAVITQS